MNKFFRIVSDVILCSIILVLLICAYLRYTNQIMIFKVATGSMEHGIHVGDYILVKRTDKFKVGDVVTVDTGSTNYDVKVIEISAQ